MGDGTRLSSLGLSCGDWLGEQPVRVTDGEFDDDDGVCRPSRPGITHDGEVARRSGPSAAAAGPCRLYVLGLVAGESASASSWWLVGIFSGGALIFFDFNPKPNRDASGPSGLEQRLGLDSGETMGLGHGEPGTSVSELDPSSQPPLLELSVSDELPPAPTAEAQSGTCRLCERSPPSSW